MNPPSAWTPWQPVSLPSPLTPPVLAEILDGGQSFRWHTDREISPPVAAPGLQPPVWSGIWANHCARLALDTDGCLFWSAPADDAARAAAALRTYLALETDFAALADALPWRSDAHLAVCLRAFPGLRLLRQPFGETLLGFLCSATKQIVQIKQMLAHLAQRHGAPLTASRSHPPAPISSLPTWPTLAEISETELRACQLGFRARHIHATARFLAAHPGWLDETERLPYAEAKTRLCELPGVGEKVADCLLLFGAGRLEAFPVDTWILKTMARRYGLTDWKPAQVAHFGRTHFGPLAGLAQQYLFAWERATARR